MMYIPSYFKVPAKETLCDILPQASFADLITVDSSGLPVATHLPLLYAADEGEFGTIYGHVARANPHWALFENRQSLINFRGPHAYVSPRFYATQINVPTWNYVAVHASGGIEIISNVTDVISVLKNLSDENEEGATEPWRVEDFDQKRLTAMTKAIVAFKLPVQKLEAKAKLGQNKKEEDRNAVADALEGSELANWQNSVR
jgi:transcriptional regulator